MHQNNYDILLINPPPVPHWDYKKKYNYTAPAGILSIGTVLKENGYSVKLIDGAYEEFYFKKVEDIIDANNLLFIGISCMTSQVTPGLKIAAHIRKVNRALPLVWGGVHPSLFPEQAARNELVDIVVAGEGEFTCLEIANYLRANKDYSHIKGTVLEIDNRIINDGAREYLDLEKLPFFDYDLLNIEQYIIKDKTDVGGRRLKDGHIRRSLPILSGLGCPYKCSFCIEPITKRKYRQRSAEMLIGEIQRLVEQYGINDISFNDPLFFGNKKRLLRFLDLLEEQRINISWSASLRANYFNENYLNIELLKRIRKLGGYHFGLGVESGSERILSKINKQIEKEDVIRCAQWSKQADINIVYSFMIGLPGETEQEMKETVKFAFRVVNHNPQNSYLNGPNVFRPYPGSNLYRECVENYNFKIPHSLEEWGRVYSSEEGYFRLEDLPWIKNPYLIRVLVFYLFRGTTNFVYPQPWMRFFGLILKKLCRLRLKPNFFYFPFEYKIMLWLKDGLLK